VRPVSVALSLVAEVPVAVAGVARTEVAPEQFDSELEVL
jgi:hypothetical protein